MKKVISLFLVLGMFGLYGCGDTNFFSWVHSRGSDESISALKADGEVALIDKDYDKAFEYFSKVLEKNPNDSVALYGRAQAAYGRAGLELSKILASALDDLSDNSSSSSALRRDINLTTNLSIVKRMPADPSALIPIDDLAGLYEANAIVIADLMKIAEGQADGAIPADDPDVNINLAIALTLQAALFILDSNADGVPLGTGDVAEINNDYEITEKNGGFTVLQGDTTFKKQVKKAMIYVVGAVKAQEAVSPESLPDYSGWRGAIGY
ncbi:hypothetical protein ACFL4S_01985, partial [bacterium]